MLQNVSLLLFLIAFVLANLPWLNERWLFVLRPPAGQPKKFWMCLVEWALLFIIWGFLAFAIEKKMMGQIYQQGWEFYVVALCLFVVFALPGFIYRYDLRPHLQRRKRRSK